MKKQGTSEKQEIYHIRYILPSATEANVSESDEEFLRQLSLQRQNRATIRAKIKISAAELTDTMRRCFPMTGTLVLWQKHAIDWGKWDGEKWRLAEAGEAEVANILELRLFNEEAELRLVRQKDNFVGRLAKDDGTGWRLYFDTASRLWGEAQGCAISREPEATLSGESLMHSSAGAVAGRDALAPAENNNGDAPGFVRLEDNGRRLKLTVPCADSSAKYYALKTRNYIDEVGDMGQLGIVDYRFVSVEPEG